MFSRKSPLHRPVRMTKTWFKLGPFQSPQAEVMFTVKAQASHSDTFLSLWLTFTVRVTVASHACVNIQTRHRPLSQPDLLQKMSKEMMHLAAVFSCKVLLQLPQSSAIIPSSDSGVSCFCWLAHCRLYFTSASGASLHGAFTRGLVSVIGGHVGSVFAGTVWTIGLFQERSRTRWQALRQAKRFLTHQIALSVICDILILVYLNSDVTYTLNTKEFTFAVVSGDLFSWKSS